MAISSWEQLPMVSPFFSFFEVKSLLLKQKDHGKMILWQNNFKLKFAERWTLWVLLMILPLNYFAFFVLVAARPRWEPLGDRIKLRIKF
jgi:hypothetical protein